MVLRGARLTMLVFAASTLAPAQRVISAKSGLIYFVQGRAAIESNGEGGVEGSGPLTTGDVLRQLRTGETLFTERGRAEVLLNPGTVLRLGDRSRLRMDDVRITDACVSILSGSAVVTVSSLPKPDRVELNLGGSVVILSHVGVYRFDANGSQARLRVYNGQAEVHRGTASAAVIVKHGRAVDLDDLQIARFDTKEIDSLQRWAELRSRTPGPRGLRPVPPRFGQRPGVAQPQQPGGFQMSDISPGVDFSGSPVLSNQNASTSSGPGH
jgi:hypothetical protein